uniref:Uncharacterized protein n=1 Tax=viral metagenome TaxID=1070528 RepID=A0A6C0C0W6_9ZZZZ
MFKSIKLEADDSYESLPLNRNSNILTYNTGSEDTLSDKEEKYNIEKKKIIPWLIGSYSSLYLFCAGADRPGARHLRAGPRAAAASCRTGLRSPSCAPARSSWSTFSSAG